ncbi:MAG: sensor histidine kinase [Deltaproteobacteria bacterium]|nr:MAG: sensor histidine kinase [Deltaproteobacteria bacterium]
MHPRSTLLVLVAAALPAALALLVVGIAASRELDAATLDMLERVARAGAGLLAETGGLDDPVLRRRLVDRLADGYGVRVTLLDPEGRAVVDSDADPATVGPRPAPVSASARTPSGWTLRVTLRTDEEEPISGRLDGPLTLGLLFAALTALGMALLSRRVLGRPLTQLVTRIEALAQRQRPRHRVHSAVAELRALSDAVDTLAEEVRRGVTRAREERDRIDAVLASMTEGVVVVDTDARVRLVNQAFRRITGAPAEVEGRPLLEVVRSERLDRAARETLEGATGTVTELTLQKRPPRTVVATVAPLVGAEGEMHGAVLVLRDVTERRRVLAMREDFVANVSHELKTPIAAVRGYAETLLDGALDDEETAREFVQTICDHAQRMQALVEDLLDLAALDAGAVEPKPSEVSVQEAVQMAFDQVQAAAKRRGVPLLRTLPRDLPPLYVDPAWIVQVLSNLLDNAIKYSEPGAPVRVEAEADHETVELRVVDQGPGVPEAARERIFERFYRVDPGRSRAMGGTGLGLSIVRHLVEQSGGSVHLVCPPEGGSIFSVRLPRAKPPIAA